MTDVLVCKLCHGALEENVEGLKKHLSGDHKIETVENLILPDFYDVYTLNKKEAGNSLAGSLARKTISTSEQLAKKGINYFLKKRQ